MYRIETKRLHFSIWFNINILPRHSSCFMKSYLYHVALILFSSAIMITISSCQKENINGSQVTPYLDTAITDTSIFIDFVLDGKRVFGIQNEHDGQYEANH